MYKGSGKYFIGVFIARFGFLYGVGSGLNTAIQMFAITVGFVSRGPQRIEYLPYFIEKWVFVALPIHPPFTAIDFFSLLFNLIVAGLVAASWTVSWSEGMSAHHGR